MYLSKNTVALSYWRKWESYTYVSRGLELCAIFNCRLLSTAALTNTFQKGRNIFPFSQFLNTQSIEKHAYILVPSMCKKISINRQRGLKSFQSCSIFNNNCTERNNFWYFLGCSERFKSKSHQTSYVQSLKPEMRT